MAGAADVMHSLDNFIRQVTPSSDNRDNSKAEDVFKNFSTIIKNLAEANINEYKFEQNQVDGILWQLIDAFGNKTETTTMYPTPTVSNY